jgi:CHRD domain-containing protein
MRKIFTTLAVVALVAATVLAIAALAGAATSKGHENERQTGTLGKGREHSGAKPDHKANRVLFARLNGRNEIGADGRRGAGDPDGRGGFTALVANDEVCFGLTVDDIDAPMAAHIHRGKRHENGPIVVTLIPPSSGDPGASSGCVPPDSGDPALLQEILKHSNRFYANVHTSAFPNGAVRGQLKHRRP